MDGIQLLDVVALTEDLPDQGLVRGQVGAVIQELVPDAYEVEFCDGQGGIALPPALQGPR